MRFGNRIDRKYGSVANRALYSDEVVSPGIILDLNTVIFCLNETEVTNWENAISSSLRVIDIGLENIGGNWSYGLGRLKPIDIKTVKLNLSNFKHIQKLWASDPDDDYSWDECASWTELDKTLPRASGKWACMRIKAAVHPGQLLAVSTQTPSYDLEQYGIAENSKLPDSFVFEEQYLNIEGQRDFRFVIPGKAFRQAVLSQALERKWRSQGETICFGDHESSKNCECKRCRWFGNANRRGLIAVMDAEVVDAELKKPDVVLLNRIQLCEHSMQNMNLFSGAYLRAGEFTFRVVVDLARAGCEGKAIIQEITALCEEMKDGGQAPPGWYRLGKTSTCTGQVEVRELVWEGGGKMPEGTS